MDHIYDYAWIDRYRNTKLMLAAPIALFLVNILFFLVSGGKSVFFSYDTYIYVLIFAMLFGFIVDYFTGTPKIYKSVLTGRDGITFGFKTEAEIFVSWVDILVIDAFDLNDIVVSGDGIPDYQSGIVSDDRITDYQLGSGLGGIRIITRLDEKFIIFKSIRKYKGLKNLIINNSINAVLKENGRRQK